MGMDCAWGRGTSLPPPPLLATSQRERKRLDAHAPSGQQYSVIQIYSLVFDASFQFVDIRDLGIRAGGGHFEHTV